MSSTEHPKLGVHLSHCNFGEWEGGCKYGDEDCPALSERWRWFGNALSRKDRAIEHLQQTLQNLMASPEGTAGSLQYRLRELYAFTVAVHAGHLDANAIYLEAAKALDAKQAKIDELMLEYCPDEMTPEQKAEWERHQRSVDPAMQTTIEEAARSAVAFVNQSLATQYVNEQVNQQMQPLYEAFGRCRKCGGEMKPGTAFQETWTTGIPDFPGQKDLQGQTLGAGGTGRLVDCMKCVECGWSVTKGEPT